MKNLTTILALVALYFFSSIKLCAQPDEFSISIKRNRVVGNLVYCSIYLNGQEIGSAFENNDLKIPTGSYKGLMRYNSGHNFVQSEMGKLSKKGDFLIEASAVVGRTDILLHQGNAPKHSKGCILLGPAKLGPDGSVTIGVDHPLRKLRLAFYGTDEPNSCPNKNISITISDDYLKTYTGSGNSNSVNFGGGGYCTWSMQNQNVSFSFIFNGQNKTLSNIQLSNDEVENTVAGNCQPAGRHRDTYNSIEANINGNNININFSPSPSNNQKCNVRFNGTISNDGNITGTITWSRYDVPQAPQINYIVTMKITLTK
jgi:hypothetical protein